MSAWRAGRGDPAFGVMANASPLEKFIDLVVKWIPGEVIAFYGVAIAVASDGLEDPEPSRSLWILMIVTTAILAILGGMTVQKPPRDIATRTILAVIAFLIWSATVPLSGWWSWDDIAENAKNVAIYSALAGLIFSKIAELIAPD